MGETSKFVNLKSNMKVSIIKSFVPSSCHCLICNCKLYPESFEGQKEVIYLFEAQTIATQHDVSVLLSNLVNNIICPEQVHSNVICGHCFRLLDRIDFLQKELSAAKEKVISQYQQTEIDYRCNNKAEVHDDDKYLAVSKKNVINCDSEEKCESDSINIITLQTSVVPIQENEKDETTESPNNEKACLPNKKENEESEILNSEEQLPENSAKRKLANLGSTTPKKKSRRRSALCPNTSARKYCPVVCAKCEASFNTSKALRSHLVEVHSVLEWEVDEFVLKSWIHQKTSSQSFELVCPWCQELYFTFDEYYDHLYQDHLAKNYDKYREIVDSFRVGSISCRMCDNSSSSLSSLDDHLKTTHWNEGIRVCLLCDEQCNGMGALLRHINHHILGVQQCTLCPCKYSTQRQFTSHLESFHLNKYFVKCTQCFLSFKTYASYEEHKNAVHEGRKGITPEPLIESSTDVVEVEIESTPSHDLKGSVSISLGGRYCDLCNVVFTYKTQYQRHLYRSHPSVFNFRCEECECLFKNFGALISHQMSHIFGVHHCPNCNVKFSRVDQIKKHLSFSHPFIKGLECKLCIKLFKTYDTYLNHLKIKHPEASGNAISYTSCGICQKNFSNKFQLQLHKRSHEKAPSVCNICGATVKYLSSHMNSHTKMVSFPCKECGVSYNSKSSLSIHFKRTHLGSSVKKHPCLECDKKFLSLCDLRTHTSRVHRGERKFVCTFCDKAYKNKVSLSYHVRKHSGQKPHECTLCNMAFEIPTGLKQHIEKDHNAVYKGIYFKKSSSICTKGGMRPDQSDSVHINIPADMRKEVVSSSVQYNCNEDKIILVVDG